MRDRINPYYVYLPNDRRTYGPKTRDGRNYTRDGAMTFARIGSQHGGPREVWDVPKKGGTPKLIRRYVGGQATYRGNPSVAPWRTDHLYFLFDPRTHLLYLGADDIAEFDFVEPTIYWNTEVVSLRDLGLLDIDPDDPNNWATFEDHDRLYGSPRANAWSFAPAVSVELRLGYGLFNVFQRYWYGQNDPLYAVLSRRGDSVDIVTVRASQDELDRLYEVAEEILQNSKDEGERHTAAEFLRQLEGERANSRRNFNPDYVWFVVYSTPTGPVIASGWEYRQDAIDAIEDAPRISGWQLLGVKHLRWLRQHGVDPMDPARWARSDMMSVSSTDTRQNRGDVRGKIEKQYQSFNHHAPKEWRNLKDVVKNVHLPTHVLPRGGVTRIWYDSDKLMEPGDRVNKVNSYVHCVLPQPQSNDQCVCGHPLHDHETTREYATVYEASTSKSALAVNWPEAVAFLGWSLGWDEFIGDQVKPVRFKRKALITFAPDLKTIIAVAAGKTYMIFGGEMRITPDGIAG